MSYLRERVIYDILEPYELCKCGLYDLAFKKFFEIARSRINQDLLDKMETTTCWISGSFILQCMYNCDWKSDIDIYEAVDYKDNGGNFSVLESFMYNEYCKAEPVTSDPGFQYSEFDPDMKIVQTRKYRPKTTNLAYDIIKVFDCDTREKQIDFVKRVFDLDICKNILWIKDGIFHLYIYNLYDVMTQSTDLKFGTNMTSSLSRSEKYKTRGITIRDNAASYKEYFEKTRKIKFTIEVTVYGNNGLISQDNRLKAYEIPGLSFHRDYHTYNTGHGWGIPDLCTCSSIGTMHIHLYRNSDYSDLREITDIIGVTYA